MDNQNKRLDLIDQTDLYGYLGDISNRLLLEGESLKALAELWHERNSEEYEIVLSFGLEIAKSGRQLTALRERLCQACQTKTVAESLSYENLSDKKEEAGGK